LTRKPIAAEIQHLQSILHGAGWILTWQTGEAVLGEIKRLQGIKLAYGGNDCGIGEAKA
jgi:hypothetical protein